MYDGDQACLETNGATVLGSALTARDEGGAATGRAEYDACGREAYASGSVGGYRFAGARGYQNDATGMRLLGARYDLLQLGRFL